ncbi:MAG TPA: hypothetical protein VGR30_03565 [Candidatus Binatia bacterium]|nr:hypothetical protein [Candidatus Binatia bacterium]
MTTADRRANALHLATHSGWYRFEREGGQWVTVGRDLTYWSATCLAVDPEDPRSVYVGTEHSGVFISHDGGESWKRADPNVPRLMISSLLTLGGNLLVGTVPAALYRKRSNGWEEIEELRKRTVGSNFPPNPDLGSRTRYLAVDPRVSTRLYVGIEVGGMLMSDDGGSTWQPANDGLSDPDVHQVFPCAHAPNLVVAACGEEGVFRSVDGARHWERVTPDGPRTYGTAVAEDYDGVIYLGVARGRPNTWLQRERANAAIFWSKDGGSHWDLAVEGLRGAVMDFCMNPFGEGVIAATSEGDLISLSSSGHHTLAADLPCITAIAVGA